MNKICAALRRLRLNILSCNAIACKSYYTSVLTLVYVRVVLHGYIRNNVWFANGEKVNLRKVSFGSCDKEIRMYMFHW